MPNTVTLVWFRQDLRMRDNPALYTAAQFSGPVVPVFIWSPEDEGGWAPGAAARVWLAASLERLDASLAKRKSRLIIRRGPVLDTLAELVRATGARRLFWTRRYEPAAQAVERELERAMAAVGVQCQSSNGSLWREPWETANSGGEPFKVFTAFWKAYQRAGAAGDPLPAPERLRAPKTWPASLTVEDLALRPAIPWDDGIREAWTPGEAGARAALERFIDESLADYADDRERPDKTGTSRLSPHLRFGEISPRQIRHAVESAATDANAKGAECFLRELGWREFSYHLLHHYPHTIDESLRLSFAAFPWRDDPRNFDAWRRGRTGYPLIDAGMRELWRTGWMHNRVRMVVASFLTKDLLIPWQTGSRFFWDCLVDADLANNTMGWQWTAGCGADAAPYFRVFNPVTQAQRFDPQGAYVRRWVPELAALPDRCLHQPWKAPETALAEAGIRLGHTYPRPIIDHAQARTRALNAYDAVR